jgi:PST family polysaccharide transporter
MPRAIAETSALLKLGAAFMASGMMTLGVAYAVRVTVLHKVGFAATGLYQSAWTLGGLYVGIILQAMGADFYPRLTASADDNAECNRLVNEQALAGLLLAGPGVLATLTFAPLVITLFYSTKFAPAVALLRWICLGMTLQVMTWPMGFIILAKSKQAVFFCSELAWTVVHIGLAWICIGTAGLNGAGMAFFGSYVFHALMIYPIVRCLSGFRWSPANRRTSVFFLSMIAAVFCSFYALPVVAATCIGAIAALIGSAYSMRTLVRLLPWDRIPLPLQRLASAIGLAPCDASLAG